jgi:O-antigen ligase
MDRLSGAPSDVVNPNGLAFVILMVFPFLHYLASVNWKNKVAYALVAPILVYALMLTASRTGFVCMLVVLVGFFMKSKHKLVLTILCVVGSVATFALLSDNLKDRYTSLVSSDTKNAGTAEGRINQFKENIEVGMRKPFVGHGLGTSAEANANYGSYGKIAHNLYAEIFEELGAIGLIIFLFFVKSILSNFRETMKILKSRDSPDVFLQAVTDAMQVWMIMNIFFSFASFGFSSYEWYLFGGLSLVLRRITLSKAVAAPEPDPDQAARDYWSGATSA